MSQRFILLCGQPASGKDVAAAYIAEKHVMWHVSAGDVIRQEARNRGMVEPFTREVLAKVKDEMDKQSSAPIASSAFAQYQKNSSKYPGGLVISGLRRIKEVQYAKDQGAEIWFIKAPDELRYEWLQQRARHDDVSLEQHIKQENIEAEGLTSEGKDGLWLNGVEKLADKFLANNRTLDDLNRQLDMAFEDKE